MSENDFSVADAIAAVSGLPQYGISELLTIMRILRSPQGCPWDKEQTHSSLRADFLEECYEAVEAIDCDDPAMMREELGDVLLQVVFHCELEAEQSHFQFADICDELCRKLIERHPHVFGETVAKDSAEVLKNWDQIKRQTKQQDSFTATLEGVCQALPALMYAQKIGKRAARAGMDWACAADAFACVKAETDELSEAMRDGTQAQMEEELGDLLFSCVNTARHLGIDAETALRAATKKFTSRFAKTEAFVLADGKEMQDLPLAALDAYWAKAKQAE